VHIPDGFLSTPVWAAMDVAALPAVAVAVRRAQRSFEDSRIPLLGVMGAFVFAAQMINFPVGVGTSSHLVGGALLAFTLGPAPACVVMAAILAIQSLVFQDGGMLALGANVFNMAIAGVFAGYLPYHWFGNGPWRRSAIFAGGALSRCDWHAANKQRVAATASLGWSMDTCRWTGSTTRRERSSVH